MNLIEIETWEDELDALGAFASLEDLENHLAKAPLNAPSLTALLDFISAAKFVERWKAEAINA